MNLNTLVVIADAARARLFRFAETDHPRAPIELREAESLVHPESRTPTGKDNREAHDTEERRRFAKTVARSVAHMVTESENKPVIVVATHAMHAFLIRELERELPNKTAVRSEIAELSEMPPSLLLKELQDRGLLAP